MKPQESLPAHSLNASQNKSFIPRFHRSASFRIRGEPECRQKERRLSTPDSCRPFSRLSSYESHDSVGWKERNSLCLSTTSSVNGDVSVRSEQADADDKCSVKSYGSCATFMSCDVTPHGLGAGDRPQSRNGKKYVLHCQRHVHTQEEYLTPTQRKDRQIRQLKAALVRATRSLEKRDMEIERLKSEVERVRLSLEQNRGSGQSSPTMQALPEEAQSFCKTADAAAATPSDNMDEKLQSAASSNGTRMFDSSARDSRELEDSGILTDIVDAEDKDNTSRDLPSLPPDSLRGTTSEDDRFYKDVARKLAKGRVGTQLLDASPEREEAWRYPIGRFPDYAAFQEKILRDLEYEKSMTILEGDEREGIPKSRTFVIEEDPASEYKKELEEVKRRHSSEYQELKEKYNDRIENLLQKLSEVNARYSELRPLYDRSQDRIRQLENQVCELKKEMAAQEEWHSQMYLKMYRKGQEAAKFEHADEVLEFAHRAPKRVSVPELLQQLHRTEHELEEVKQMYRCELYKHAAKGSTDRQAEYTLKFLKDAVYYFLTEKDNKGHLRAIESILGFTDTERMTIAKSLKSRRL